MRMPAACATDTPLIGGSIVRHLIPLITYTLTIEYKRFRDPLYGMTLRNALSLVSE